MHVRSKEVQIVSQHNQAKVNADLCPSGVPGFTTPAARGEFFREDGVSCMHENQQPKTSAWRMGDICCSDMLLFMAITGCILSASGVIPKALSSIAGEFLLAYLLTLTGVMLFWLLCPMSITGALSVLRFRADGVRAHDRSQPFSE